MSAFPRTHLGWKLRILWGSIALDTKSVRFGKFLSFFVIIAFSIGATIFFIGIFSRLLAIEGIGQPLLIRIINIMLTTVFAMLVVSNLITGIATLYRSDEISFLFSKPITPQSVFLSRFFDNLAYSSWSLAVLGIPIIIAWGLVHNLPWYYSAILIIFGLFPLVIISAEIGVAILAVLVYLARKTSAKFSMSLVIVVMISALIYIALNRSDNLIVDGAARTSTVERYLANLSQEERNLAIPSNWLSFALTGLARSNINKSLFFIALLSLTSIVWLRWLTTILGGMYYNNWSVFNEIVGKKGGTSQARAAQRFTRGWLPNPLNAMLRKDFLLFRRNPSQWGQFLILVAFLLVYLLNLVYVSSRLDFDNPFWKTMILFLNFAFTGFILATLSVRFVYPLISLEGKSFWVVRSAPVSVKLLFWEKFFLAFAVFMGLCELIVWFTNRVLNVTSAMMTLTTVGTFLMGAALTALGIGMGALFPNFKEESPMKIASTPGGILTVVLSLLYVAVMVAILAWPARGYFVYLLGNGPFPAGRALTALIFVTGINMLILLLPVKLGKRSIELKDV